MIFSWVFGFVTQLSRTRLRAGRLTLWIGVPRRITHVYNRNQTPASLSFKAIRSRCNSMSNEADRAFRYYVVRDVGLPVSWVVALFVAAFSDPSFAMLPIVIGVLVAHRATRQLKTLNFRLSLEQKRQRYRLFILSDAVALGALLLVACIERRPLWWAISAFGIIVFPFALFYGRHVIYEEER
jgi:hypothetical protein